LNHLVFELDSISLFVLKGQLFASFVMKISVLKEYNIKMHKKKSYIVTAIQGQ
jgi:hypothetical protein